MSKTITPLQHAKVGYFGKQPDYGDFISRRLPNSFVSVWDEWLSLAVSQSRSMLGSDWLDAYMTSPLWRFAISPGICGNTCWAGVLMPSVDSIGRHFPLTLAIELPAETDLPSLVVSNEAWFNRCEEVALSSLLECFNLDAFDREAAAIPPPQLFNRPAPAGTRKLHALHFQLPALDPFNHGIRELEDNLLSQLPAQHSLWWSHGSNQISPSLLVLGELPPDTLFASLLNGQWESYGWKHYNLTDTSYPV